MTALFSMKLALILVLFLVLVSGLCAIGRLVGIWAFELTTDTEVWMSSVGFILLFSIDGAATDSLLFPKVILRSLEVTAILGFVLNMFVFSFYVEVVIPPLIFLFAGISAFAASKPEYRATKKIADVVLSLAGIAVLAFAGVRLVGEWQEIELVETLRALVLPVWPTIGIIPFVYIVAVFATYELILLRMSIAARRPSVPWAVRLAVIISFRLSLSELRGVSVRSLREIGSSVSFTEARVQIGHARRNSSASNSGV
ncbi:MAG: hypothetical protein DK306_000022 [Chloroflexi bacterium]|nr:MAG: hypothetical protein DK306_000022 [Chloroflexota bacterium]